MENAPCLPGWQLIFVSTNFKVLHHFRIVPVIIAFHQPHTGSQADFEDFLGLSEVLSH